MKDETVNVVPAKYNQGSAVQIDYDPAADLAGPSLGLSRIDGR